MSINSNSIRVPHLMSFQINLNLEALECNCLREIVRCWTDGGRSVYGQGQGWFTVGSQWGRGRFTGVSLAVHSRVTVVSRTVHGRFTVGSHSVQSRVTVTAPLARTAPRRWQLRF